MVESREKLCFHQGARIGCKSRKASFYVLCFFTPFIFAFQALSCLANDRSWRDLSIGIKKSISCLVAWYGHVWWKSIENLSNIHRNPIELLSKNCANRVESLWNINWHSSFHGLWLGIGSFRVFARCILEILLRFYWNSIEFILKFYRNCI